MYCHGTLIQKDENYNDVRKYFRKTKNIYIFHGKIRKYVIPAIMFENIAEAAFSSVIFQVDFYGLKKYTYKLSDSRGITCTIEIELILYFFSSFTINKFYFITFEYSNIFYRYLGKDN